MTLRIPIIIVIVFTIFLILELTLKSPVGFIISTAADKGSRKRINIANDIPKISSNKLDSLSSIIGHTKIPKKKAPAIIHTIKAII